MRKWECLVCRYIYGEEKPNGADEEWEPRYTYIETSSGRIIKTILNNKTDPLFIIGKGNIHLGRSKDNTNSNGKLHTSSYGIIHVNGDLFMYKNAEFNGLVLVKGRVVDEGSANNDAMAKINGFMIFYLLYPDDPSNKQEWKLQKIKPTLDHEYKNLYKTYLPYSLEIEKIKEIVN